MAFISGRVKIDFPNKEQIEWLMHTMEKAGDAKFKKFDQKSKVDLAIYTEMQAQAEINDLIAVCCGTRKAASYEQKRAFNELFHKILAYRAGGRIVGEFVNYDIAERVERLEQGIEKINNLLKQLVEIHSTEMGL
ncbi:MAG: hypothetical protein M1490_00715 [Candidatus Bathyarchaeota archaeon]|nr:hypothetical protein [Candidatus Bathyarchaeota archaeon]